MASDEFSLQTLPEGDSSEELRRFVNGMVCNLPVKDTIVGNETAATLSQAKQSMLYP